MDSKDSSVDGISLSALSVEERIQALAVLIADTLALRIQEEAMIAEELED